jgi:isopenicillin N synthase-like dioxygenase
MTGFHVPVIDITAYVTGGTDPEKAAVAAAVDAAAREVGFIQLTGHGIDPQVRDGLASALDAFFLRDLAVKKQVTTPPSVNRGYSPPKSERLSLSLGVESATGMNDFFEAFNIGAQASDFPGLSLPAADYPENVWPDALDGFRENLEAWFGAAQSVAGTLVDIFEDALGQPRGTIGALADHSIDVLRTINYALEPGLPWNSTVSSTGWASTPTTGSSRSCGPTVSPGCRCSDRTGRGTMCCPSRVPCWSTWVT